METSLDWYSVGLAGFSLLVCFGLPIFVYFKLMRIYKNKQLNDKNMKYWYGELYE
jgi:hypothetical protein